MSIEFGCPSCDKRYRVEDRLAGKNVTCKGCGTAFRVPVARPGAIASTNDASELASDTSSIVNEIGDPGASPATSSQSASPPPSTAGTLTPSSSPPVASPPSFTSQPMRAASPPTAGGTAVPPPPFVGGVAAPPSPAGRVAQSVPPPLPASAFQPAIPRPVRTLPRGQIACLLCGTANSSATSFCVSCGRALPAEIPTGPRVVGGVDLPTTEAGRSVVAGQLSKEISVACWILLVLAIAHAVLTPAVLAASLKATQTAHPGRFFFIRPSAYLGGFAISAAFWILFAWAMRNPLPAAIVGLVLYVTLTAVDLVYEFGSATGESKPVTTIVVAMVIRAFVVLLLVRAIKAGVRFRNLSRGPIEVPA